MIIAERGSEFYQSPTEKSHEGEEICTMKRLPSRRVEGVDQALFMDLE
jgi:hypothetical protein